MCGIIGFNYLDGFKVDLESKLDVIQHRGPDGRGFYDGKNGNWSYGLGHTRLSIIDLSDNASQPFISNCGNYIIVFNGELYNYQELRDKYDLHCRTNSDTEVLLELFIRFGERILNELHGMFAFAIYNKTTDDLVIVRDQLGIKPVYYFWDEKRLIFGSEIKAIFHLDEVKKEMQPNLVEEFLLNGFLYEPDTGYSNIKKIEPGCCLKFRKGELQEVRYWNPKVDEDIIEESVIKKEIDKSIQGHLVSDVPVGLFFSGGIDSSLILGSISNKIKSFVVSSEADDPKGDFYYAQRIAKKFNRELHNIQIDEKIKNSDDFVEEVSRLSVLTEEPISDFTFLSSRLIASEARKRGYTVMLSGMGADELFAGYPRYTLVKYGFLFKIIKKVIPAKLLNKGSFSKKADRFVSFFNEDMFIYKYASLVGYFSKSEIERITKLKTNFSSYESKMNRILGDRKVSDFKKAMLLDMHGFLSHNFMVADKSTMLESIELRVPLATKDLIEITLRMKENQLLNLKNTKVVLKKMLFKMGLPKPYVFRKKQGFNPPLDGYIKELGNNRLIQIFQENGIFKHLKKSEILKLIEEHFKGKKNHTYRLFQILYLSFWIKNNFNVD